MAEFDALSRTLEPDDLGSEPLDCQPQFAVALLEGPDFIERYCEPRTQALLARWTFRPRHAVRILAGQLPDLRQQVILGVQESPGHSSRSGDGVDGNPLLPREHLVDRGPGLGPRGFMPVSVRSSKRSETVLVTHPCRHSRPVSR